MHKPAVPHHEVSGFATDGNSSVVAQELLSATDSPPTTTTTQRQTKQYAHHSLRNEGPNN